MERYNKERSAPVGSFVPNPLGNRATPHLSILSFLMSVAANSAAGTIPCPQQSQLQLLYLQEL